MADKPEDVKEEPREETPEGQEGEGAPKKSKKKLIIIGALAALLIIGGAAGAYFGGFIGKHAEGGEEGGHEAAAEHGEAKAGEPVFVDLPEFLVNLNTSSRQTSFLKLTVSLELASMEDSKNLQAKLPRVIDSFNTYLRELRATDLYGSAGVYRLREELLVRVNKAVEPIKVKDILFKQILVQ